MSEAHKGDGRFEKKLTLPAGQVAFMAHWLEHTCRRDAEYPMNTVSSIYYDTPRLDLYRAKDNSDFLKLKIRARWYGPAETMQAPLYLEAKTKEGTRVGKQRHRIDPHDPLLAEVTLEAPMPAHLRALAAALAPYDPGPLLPTCIVSYERRRFVDTLTGWRISLDSRITAIAGSCSGPCEYRRAELDSAVLELKGTRGSPHVPAHLRPHPGIRLLPENFSKYAAALARLRGFGTA